MDTKNELRIIQSLFTGKCETEGLTKEEIKPLSKAVKDQFTAFQKYMKASNSYMEIMGDNIKYVPTVGEIDRVKKQENEDKYA